MKKSFTKIILLGAMLLSICACEDDADLTTLTPVSFSETIVATPETIVLNTENSFKSVLTVSWTDVEYPIEAPVIYTVQADVLADTFGNNAWANAINVDAGQDVLSRSFLGEELNDMALQLGLQPNVQGELVIRIEAYLDRFVFSELVTIQLTPYQEETALGEIYIPGSYNGFDTLTAARLPEISRGVYQGYLTVSVPQGLGFKVTPERNFDQFYGLDGSGNFALAGDTDLTFPEFGSYQITVNLNNLSYTIISFSWGIIGQATPGGWDADTDMSYNYIDEKWEYTGTLVPGPIKFRLNNEWTINYGTEDGNSDEITDGIMFLDNPGAHTVTEEGFYTVSFSVDEDPATASYSVTQASVSWGVIGTSTPDGYDADTDMIYDFATAKWIYTGYLVPGELKFRLNNEWTINYGTGDGNSDEIVDGIMFLDNPGVHNITIAGDYQVIFSVDSEDSSTATYSIILQ